MAEFVVEDINLETAECALRDQGFSLDQHLDGNRNVASADIWTDYIDGEPGGFRIGTINRRLSGFAPRYDMRITEHQLRSRDGSGQDRLMKVLSAIVNRDNAY